MRRDRLKRRLRRYYRSQRRRERRPIRRARLASFGRFVIEHGLPIATDAIERRLTRERDDQ